MANDYSSADEDIMEAQMGQRKRRKLSEERSDSESEIAPVVTTLSTISRVKLGKSSDAVQPVSRAPARVPTKDTGSSPQKDAKEKTSFASIDVAPWLVASLASMEIKRPTGIQKACIPEILKGRDCIGGSRTGTGKTVAFSVPILQKWAEDPCGIFGLIIT